MKQPFKIFRLPSVALDVVLNELTIQEIFNLSECSKKSHLKMKQFIRRRSYISSLHLGHTCNFTISVVNGWDDTKFKKETHDCIQEKEDGDQVLREDIRLEIFRMLDLFRPVTSLSIISNSVLEPLVLMIKELSLNLTDVFISGHCHAKPPEMFELENIPKFTCDKIDIAFSFWVTVDNIVNGFIYCKTVIFQDCAILANTIYPIVRKWLDSRSRLEKMDLMLRGKGGSIPIGDILRDIPCREVDGEYVIRREDGIEARIRCSKTQFKMVIS